MDFRIVMVAAVGLVLVAVGGFYFAFSTRSHDMVPPRAQPAAASPPGTPVPADQRSSSSQKQVSAPASPGRATAESIEAEIARSDHGELQALLKRNFPKEYSELIKLAVQRRNEGASGQAFGEELFGRFQEIMRAKLKFAVAASMPMIDKLATNEVSLFHALANEGAGFCLKVLGRDTTPVSGPLPDSVQRLMRLGTLYRFQAIVEGMARSEQVEPLTNEEMAAFEATLARIGLNFDEVRTGAFLNKEGDQGGKPCLMIERLYRSISQLDDGARRKLYSGMFFLGRDQ